MLYYTIPYYAILYYIIVYYNLLYFTILYYTIVNYTILYYTILTLTPSVRSSEGALRGWRNPVELASVIRVKRTAKPSEDLLIAITNSY